jgi:hypothetical protein
MLKIAGVALVAVAVAYRIPQAKGIIFDDGGFFG